MNVGIIALRRDVEDKWHRYVRKHASINCFGASSSVGKLIWKIGQLEESSEFDQVSKMSEEMKSVRFFSPISLFLGLNLLGWRSRWEDKMKTNVVGRARIPTFFFFPSSLPHICKDIFPENIVPGDENRFYCSHLIILPTLVDLDNHPVLQGFMQKLTWCLHCPNPVTGTLSSSLLCWVELNVVFKSMGA